jgi:hypothetical protein
MLYIGEYRIWADTHNVILEEYRMSEPKKKEQEPEEKWFHIGYYSNFSSAVKRILDEKSKKIDSETVEGFLSEMNKIKDTIIASTSHIEVIERKEFSRGRKTREENED